ncbi:hypothetical protein LBMAG18_02400 [Alphaproteobacteria bacterium]|nr:hypothetical protein LBMAG18_02400 [Alphaproteobacteria bacterium]
MTHHNLFEQNIIALNSGESIDQSNNTNNSNLSQAYNPVCLKQNIIDNNPDNYEINLSSVNVSKDNKKFVNNNQKIIDCLRLIRSENIGVFSFWQLIEFFGDVSTAVKEADNFFKKLNLKKKVKIASMDLVEKELEDTEKFGARLISFFDDDYPKSLQKIFDSPPVITVKGDISLLEHNSISIVGSRNCSFNGANIAKKIAVEFGQNSFITISGLARGIDSAVHEASILSGTIGVIAGGINSIYPHENRRLYQQISEVGLLISEMPFNAPPKSNYFIKRNRIISALSSSLIVIEASAKSGSLATARFALEQGREVFACAGSPFDPRCSGVNQLIRDGANIISNLDHLIDDVKKIATNFRKGLANQITSPKINSQTYDNVFNNKKNYNYVLQSDKLFEDLLIDIKQNDNTSDILDQEYNSFLSGQELFSSENSSINSHEDFKNQESLFNKNNNSYSYSTSENLDKNVNLKKSACLPEEANLLPQEDQALVKKNKAKSTHGKKEVIIIGKVKNYANNNDDIIDKKKSNQINHSHSNQSQINQDEINRKENKFLAIKKNDTNNIINNSIENNNPNNHNNPNYHCTFFEDNFENYSLKSQDNNVSNDFQNCDSKNMVSNDLSESQMQVILDNIFAKINHNPIAIDDIIQQLNLPARIINVALVQLEISGKISVNQGKVYGESKLLYG